VPELLCNDSTYILWCICNHIHHNNVAFTEHIHENITTATILQFNNDILQYLIYIKENLWMMSSTNQDDAIHNGLITYILRQLKLSNICLFQDCIRKLHVSFQEARLPNLTVNNLILQIEDKIRVLRHAGECFELETNDRSAMALSAIPKLNNQIEDLVMKQVKSQLQSLIMKQKKLNHSNNNKTGKFHQEWMFIPPSKLVEI
jgi:hypothetical protein